MEKLNQFFLKTQISNLSMEGIMKQAGVESVVYFERDFLYKSNEWNLIVDKDYFYIGLFIHSPFWLTDNQINFLKFYFSKHTDDKYGIWNKDIDEYGFNLNEIRLNEVISKFFSSKALWHLLLD